MENALDRLEGRVEKLEKVSTRQYARVVNKKFTHFELFVKKITRALNRKTKIWSEFRFTEKPLSHSLGEFLTRKEFGLFDPNFTYEKSVEDLELMVRKVSRFYPKERRIDLLLDVHWGPEHLSRFEVSISHDLYNHIEGSQVFNKHFYYSDPF